MESQASSLHSEVNFVGLHPELCYVALWYDSHEYRPIQAKEANQMMHAHRMVVALLIGNLASGDMVLHRCGVADCINPYHLYVGGSAENRRDEALHKPTRGQTGPYSLTYPSVSMPQPLVLSQEISRITKSFAGFSPTKCFIADWLPSTSDGYRQLCASEFSGELVGAHRKIYKLFVGPIDRYEIVSHTCGNKHTCLNPYHMRITGRQKSHRDFDFEHDKRVKVSASGLELIADVSRSTTEVALELGIHPQTAYRIRADIKRSQRR